MSTSSADLGSPRIYTTLRDVTLQEVIAEYVNSLMVPRKGLDGADCTVVHGDAPEYEVATR